MRMFVVSVIGLAGLASIFAYCPPLRDKARGVVFGQEAIALSSTTSEQPERTDGAGVGKTEAPGGST